ncbi:hypothetical protein M3206_18640 [Fictibacillus phosphorivorans]|nr:hypothetical protein [Fictibacillus phosphorivorans]MCM3720341.1 hypothetical protein [Fictibacillus phosphorivorans]MCM3778025.1 hypothetical protein [Fictibacillus phosphorivorans]
MIGMVLNHQELNEFEYVLKKEMEELLYDLEDQKIDGIVKSVLEERYQIIYRLFCRFAKPADCRKYLRQKQRN